MHLQKDQIIALFGASGTGKSAIAKELAEKLGVPLRMCGEEVKSAAKSRGISLAGLCDDDHLAIDTETRHWISTSNEGCVVEGRFLDMVLSLYPQPECITLIQLNSDVEVRAARISARSGKGVSVTQVAEFDNDDALFRERVYKGWRPLMLSLPIDNSKDGLHECILNIIAQLSAMAERG